MKKMTKVLSLLLAVAMMLSLVTVNVAAADELTATLTSPAAVVGGADQEVTLDLVFSNNPGIIGTTINFSFDTAALELVKVEDKQAFAGWLGWNGTGNKTNTIAWLDDSADSNNTFNGVAATVTLKVKASAAKGNYPVTLTVQDGSTVNADMADVAINLVDATVSVIEETNITSITAATASVPYGADEAAVKAALPATVKGSGQTTGGTPVTDMDLKVASWDVSAVNTNPETAATQVAKATLEDIAGVNVSDAAKAQAVANITLTALTTGTIEAEAEMKVPVKAENAAYTTEELKALVEAKYKKVTVKNGALEAEYVPTVTVTGTPANVGDTATATLSVSGASENGKFNITTVTKEVTITLIPAEVTDGSASWKASTVISSNTNIKVAVDYAAEYAGKKLVVSVVTDAEGATPVTKEFDLPALPEDAAEGAKGSYTAELGKLKAIFGTAPAAGTILTFGVKVDGAAVAYEVAEDGTATMEQTVKVANSSSGSSPSGLPGGGGSTSTKKTYTIVVEKSENGTATAPEKAAKGDKVTVTTTPAEGYKTDVITVKTGKGINIPVTDKSFTMPDANVTITVTFVEGEEPTTPDTPSTPGSDLFSDVPSTHWAYSFIKEMKDLGIVNGVSNTEFAPDANITRAEFAKMVAQAFGLKATATESVFTDCTASDWYTPFVIAGTEAGILKGISDTEFGANQQITRQDICTVLGRILDAENTISAAADSSFTDIDQVADYAVAAVKAFVAAGVVNGYEDGTFRPTANATRAEVSKILCSVLKLDNAVSKAAYAALTGAEVEAEPAADADADANAEDTTKTDAEDTTVDDGSAPEK